MDSLRSTAEAEDPVFEDCISDEDFPEHPRQTEWRSHPSQSQASLQDLSSKIPSGVQLLIEAPQRHPKCQGIKLSLTSDVARCRDLMAKESPPFYHFSRLLSAEQRHAIWSVFAVVQALEAACLNGSQEECRNRLRQAFDLDQDMCDGSGEWNALRMVIRRYPLSRRSFEDFIDGRIAWISAFTSASPDESRLVTLFRTKEDLFLQAYRSAGALGLMVLPILAEQSFYDSQVLEAAMAMGVSLQIVDWLNCVGHHGRTCDFCAIPEEVLTRHRIDSAELVQNITGKSSTLQNDPRHQAMMKEMLGHVPLLLIMARRGGEKLPLSSRVAVRLAIRMCRRVLTSIEARGYNSLGPHQAMFSLSILSDAAGAMWSAGEVLDEAGEDVLRI